MFIPVIPDLHKQVHPGGMLAAALRFLFPTSRDNSGVILKTIFVEELFCNSKIIVKNCLTNSRSIPEFYVSKAYRCLTVITSEMKSPSQIPHHTHKTEANKLCWHHTRGSKRAGEQLIGACLEIAELTSCPKRALGVENDRLLETHVLCLR